MWGSIVGGVSWRRLTGSRDDDWIDRANHLWTVCLLILFAVIVSSGQYVGDPIHCWCPAEFTGTYVAYTKNYCWISNTYYVPMEEGIPLDIRERQNRELTYYQWVPIILLFQAFLFKFPNVVWHLLHGTAGINLSRVVHLTEATQLGKPEDRSVIIHQIARYLDRWLKANREYHRNFLVKLKQRLSNVFLFCFGRRQGHYLTGFYIFVKILYCVNCVGQFYLLNAFLAMDYGVFGFEFIKHMNENGEWRESPRFPRVTLCDFEIRQLQNVQRWTVQCVLPINLFNEKIFVFLWFWLFLISFLTFYNLATWLFHILFRHNKQVFIRKYLRAADQLRSGFDKKLARKFADEYLRDDGVFVLKVIGKNSSNILLTDLIEELWKIYRQEPLGKRTMSNETNEEEPFT